MILLLACVLATAIWAVASMLRGRVAPTGYPAGPRDAVDEFARALAALDPEAGGGGARHRAAPSRKPRRSSPQRSARRP